MIFSLSFNIEGVYGPGGSVHASIEEVLRAAAPLAESALDQMDDLVNELEWFDVFGAEADPRDLLRCDDGDEIQNAISQISDVMKARDSGWIDIQSHDNIFDLVEEHDALAWTSDQFKQRYAELRTLHAALARDLSDEWSAV